MIRAEGIRFAYPSGPELLRGCDLTVEAGEVAALAGPNGSGKTTLLKLVAGLVKPSAGTVILDGRPVISWDRIQRAKRLAYVPQRPLLPEDWTVEDIVSLGDFPHREEPPAPRPLAERLDEARRRLHLGPFWRRAAGTLSGGEAQRVALARALVQDAPVLILDEPASHLDLSHQMALYNLLDELARSGRTILLSTHDINLSRLFCQRLAFLNGSGVVKGLPEEPPAQGELLREVFGVGFLPQEMDGVACWFPDVSAFRGGRRAFRPREK
jgi:iron complex transport system ATP-binding protein